MSKSVFKRFKDIDEYVNAPEASIVVGPDSIDEDGLGLADGVGAELSDFLARGLRFEPRKEEKATLDRLSDRIDQMMSDHYGRVDSDIDAFFKKLEEGEGFGKLEAGDLERLILEIQKTIYLVTDVVASLYTDTYFAEKIQRDEFWAAYQKLDGKATISDRNAHAYAQTRESRYYFYSVYLVWHRIQNKLSALKDLQRTLEWFRNRSIRDKPF